MKQKKIFYAVLLALMLSFSVLPVARAADLSIIPATGWNYVGNTLTITVNGTYTISGTSTTDVIVVSPGLTNVNITLNGVNIDVSGANNVSAFNITGAAVNLTLVGDNTLRSGSNRAGLEVPEGSTLTIDGGGSLTARGGDSSGSGWREGVGIGGSGSSDNTIIINGGVVTATSSEGAGISGGTITINDGVVTATSGIGIGIGAGGTIIINGGVITARPGNNPFVAGISGGAGIHGDTITINGGVITAMGGVTGGAGIRGGTITIIGGDVTAGRFHDGYNDVSITGPSVTVAAGVLSVAVSLTQSETPSYQWYSNTTNDNSGGSPIPGATNSSFAIPANLPAGIHYYYCVINWSAIGEIRGVIRLHSKIAAVTVGENGGGGSSSGCDAGYGLLALALMGTVPFVIRSRSL